MKIYMATWLCDRSVGDTLTKKEATKRLLSYFFLKTQDIPQKGFIEYVETGRFDPRKNKEDLHIKRKGNPITKEEVSKFRHIFDDQ